MRGRVARRAVKSTYKRVASTLTCRGGNADSTDSIRARVMMPNIVTLTKTNVDPTLTSTNVIWEDRTSGSDKPIFPLPTTISPAGDISVIWRLTASVRLDICWEDVRCPRRTPVSLFVYCISRNTILRSTRRRRSVLAGINYYLLVAVSSSSSPLVCTLC